MTEKLTAANSALILLATCIKIFGKENVLALPSVDLQVPFVIKLSDLTDAVGLVLVEGQESIEDWNQISKVEETNGQENQSSNQETD